MIQQETPTGEYEDVDLPPFVMPSYPPDITNVPPGAKVVPNADPERLADTLATLVSGGTLSVEDGEWRGGLWLTAVRSLLRKGYSAQIMLNDGVYLVTMGK